MGVKTRSRPRGRATTRRRPAGVWPRLLRQLPGLAAGIALALLAPRLAAVGLDAYARAAHAVSGLFSPLAPLFTPEVDYWAGDIRRWAADYGLEPNLLATVMQIESCGHPTIHSPAGAQGLFQVMPFHFASGEDMLDPDTNARRSANFLKACQGYAGGDIGLTLACYNGGPRVTQTPSSQWPDEARRYYRWGTAIYADALVGKPHSETLDQWLAAGGERLCQMAAAAQRARP